MSRQSSPTNSSPSTTQPPATTSSAPARSSSMQRPVRKKSLRLSNQSINIPIPPSLLESPYLKSPESIFQRAATSPRHPSKEDEQWLQDTVPLPANAREECEERPRSMEVPRREALRGEQSRGRTTESRSMSHHATPSPPLRWHHSITLSPAVWIGPAKTRSKPTVTEQGYFAGAT